MHRALLRTALLAVLTLSPGTHPGIAAVVYGNLGADGAGPLGGTSTDYGPTDEEERLIAQGFTVGAASPDVYLQSIRIGLYYDPVLTAPRTAAIYSDSLGPDALLYTSEIVPVGNKGTYTFQFQNALLTPGSTYWIVPEGPASWYLNAANTAPETLNESGYTYTGTRYLNTSGEWVGAMFSSYSLSISATDSVVPEPGTLALLTFTGMLILVLRRRRFCQRDNAPPIGENR